jgi:hypothetical protein
VNLGSNAIVTAFSEVTSPLNGRVSVHRQSESGPLPCEVICPSKCPPDWEVTCHRCEQFSGNPTVASEPARTAFELNDPRHAPTRDCGLATGAVVVVVVVGEVGAATVPLQLLNTSAAVIGRMKMQVRTARQTAT